MPRKKSTPVKNLVRNVKAITRATKKATKKKTTKKKQPILPPTGARSYSLRQLSKKQHASVKAYLLDIEQNATKLEALKQPGELWYFTLFGNRSRLYDSLELAAPALLEWAMSAQEPSHGSQTDSGLLQGIKLLKFKGRGVKTAKDLSDEDFEKTESQFESIRGRAREKRRMEKQETFEEAKKMFTPKKGEKPSTFGFLKSAIESIKASQNTPRKKRASHGLLKSSLDALAKAQKQIQKLQRANAKLLKQLTPSKPAKQATKKKTAAKKQATKKKTAAKKQATKKKTTPKKGAKKKK